jgi:hypothetical protein
MVKQTSNITYVFWLQGSALFIYIILQVEPENGVTR